MAAITGPPMPAGGVSNHGYIDYKRRKVSAISKINTSSCQAEFSGRKISKPYSRASTFYCCSHNKLGTDEGFGEWGLDFGAKLSEQFRGIVRKFQVILENLKAKDEGNPEREWDKWQEYFHFVDKKAKFRSDLEILLEFAVKSQNFKEAARLKLLVDKITAYDTAGEVISQQKKAVAEERYEDAAKLRDVTCVGLVGWWAGLADSASDPYGRIIHISPEHGRFVARSYNARQLAVAGPGVPLFEIFINKDSDQEYKQQEVYLQRNGQCAYGSLSRLTKDTKELEKDMEKNDDTELEDEGLRHVLKFLRSGMPGLKFKVLKIATSERVDTDIISGVFDRLIQDINKEKDDEIIPSEGSIREFRTGADLHNDKVTVGANDLGELIQFAAAKVAFGTLLQSIAEDAPPNVPVRVQARIEKKGHDSFCFQIEDDGNQQSAGGNSWKVATFARQTSAVPMSADVPEAVWNVDKEKAMQEFGEIITLAVNEAQKRRGLHVSTVFRRINIEAANADPFCGLYTGTFGPSTSEVIQLKRGFGRWHDDNNATPSKGSKFEFYEYVEAVKLTGNMIIPAGQVTFRAKIGKEYLLPHDIYPEELGVVARYRGQERQAQSGFRNCEWVDGELLLLDGKGTGANTGPHLGFLLSMREFSIPAWFKRLNLSE
ncbi:hypothetical protein KI387_023502 [Taxus chinensis]|uniref:Uncharacterized protein n=1 Tax=Taxus chinensis TaxID=29808 RepID=A0AA38G371_TAXCH|nr:hypothetical protein KI387_023502 [Taxus chinensis]